jgi:Holliday junction resolvase RusA-like endonuclease
VRSTTGSVITELEGLGLQEGFGKIAAELRRNSSTWYERYSRDGRRGVLLIVMGQPYSKANSRRIVTARNGRRMVIKSEEALAYAKTWAMQCPALRIPLQGELRVTGALMYASMRPDLDESLILDLAQGRIYKNDRQVMQKFFVRGVDTERPRAVLLFEELRPGQVELQLDSPPSYR